MSTTAQRPPESGEGSGPAGRSPRLIHSEATMEIPVHLLFRDDPQDMAAASGTAGVPLGSAVVRRLRQSGFSNLLVATRDQLDLRDQAAVNYWFKANRPDYVLLVAGTVGGIMANSTRPAEFLYDNLMIEANVTHASWRAGVEKLLFQIGLALLLSFFTYYYGGNLIVELPRKLTVASTGTISRTFGGVQGNLSIAIPAGQMRKFESASDLFVFVGEDARREQCGVDRS